MQCWLLLMDLEHVQPDGQEALRQVGQARQALEAVQQPQLGNGPGRQGHLLRGPEVIAPEELDERLQRRAPQAMGPLPKVSEPEVTPRPQAEPALPCTAAPATPASIESLCSSSWCCGCLAATHASMDLHLPLGGPEREQIHIQEARSLAVRINYHYRPFRAFTPHRYIIGYENCAIPFTPLDHHMLPSHPTDR